ncbi:MAG: nucleotidyltransferase domain-containing protein, partial [Armatimonadetes bacterium]|nr:nucleotidyltransferase domain-containing protein [Armatimonadota bacterium]
MLVEWLGCPRELRQSLVHHAANVGGLLGDQLVGLYVHGSVARGCFSSATSDIDVIAVLAGPCTDEIAQDVAAIHTVSDLPL